MDHRDAVDLLRHAPLAKGAPQRWAELGCGTGTFTRALADLLPPGSSIAAMDRDDAALKQVPEMHGTTRITRHLGDFETGALPYTDLDGILLANALHFVRDQSSFIRRASACLKPAGLPAAAGAYLLVEYDTDSPNPWVPHPLSFDKLERLFKACGFGTIERLSERPSAFGRARLYAAWVGRDGAE